MNPSLRAPAVGLLLVGAALSASGQLARPGRLLLAEDFRALSAYTKEAQPVGEGWRVKVWHGAWQRTAEGLESHWEKGHNPVIVFEGGVRDAIIEVDFRYRKEEGKNAYLRIGPMARELDPRAYTVSAWVNADAKARPGGVILEHEEWRSQGYTGVATRIASFAPDTWYTVRLEIVGDQALVTCNGVTAAGRYEKFALPKPMIALGVGHSRHELRRLRIYEATANPSWQPPTAKDQPTYAIEDIPGRGPLSPATIEKIQRMTPLFDGRTLAGWIQAPAAPLALGRDDVRDPAALARRLRAAADPVSAYLRARLDAAGQADLAIVEAGGAESRSALGRLLQSVNAALAPDSPWYDAERFAAVALRPTTAAWLGQPPTGLARARWHRLLLEDAYPAELKRSPDTGWVARDGVLASTGAGRGVIYTEKDYHNYRLIFQVRQTAGNHFPGVLLFGQRPPPGELGLDALGGIQFAVPSGGHWDYRPGINKSGTHFRRALRVRYQLQEWAQVEILVQGRKGTARMAVAQPVGTRPIEILRFDDPAAGRSGPIALQMHNAGLFDEYRDLRIEVDPPEDKLITLD